MKIMNFLKRSTRENGASSQWLNVPKRFSFTKSTIECTFNDDDDSVSILSSTQTIDSSTDAFNPTTIDMIENDLSYLLDLDDEFKDSPLEWSISLRYNDLKNQLNNSSIAGQMHEVDEQENKAEQITSTTLELDEQEKKPEKTTRMAVEPEEHEKKAETRTMKYDDKDEEEDEAFTSIFADVTLEEFEVERRKAIKSMGWNPRRRSSLARSVMQALQRLSQAR